MADIVATVKPQLEIGALSSQVRRELNSQKFEIRDLRFNTQPLGRIKGQLGEFQKSLDASNARVLAFGASAGAIFAISTALKASVRAGIEVQKTLAEINVILGQSSSGLQKFGDSLFEIASRSGQAFSVAAKAAQELARQGLGVEQTLKRTSDALILARLSGLSVEDAVTSITATLNSFNNVALDSTKIINQLAAVDARFAVSSADLAEALKRVGSTASDIGVSFEQLIALVTAAQQTTARGGAVIGNAFKSIFTRLQRPKVLEQIEGLGIAVKNLDGSTKPLLNVLGELANKFDELSSAQQSQISELIGGVYQINILRATLGDLGKSYSIYANALNIANTATDEATRRNEELNKTLSSKLAKTLNDLTKLGANFSGAVFEPAINKILNTLQNVLNTGNPGEKIGEVILSGIGKVLSGPGLVFGTAIFLQLGKRFLTFLNDSIKQVSGFNTAKENQLNIEKQILNFVKQNKDIQDLLQKGQLTQNTLEEEFVKRVIQGNKQLEFQLGLTSKIAANMSRMGFSYTGEEKYSAGIKSPTKAAGHIPTLMETAGAKAGGYKAGQVKEINLGGKKAFYNTAEKVVPYKNSAFIIPPDGSKARRNYDKQLKSRGIDPNMFSSGGFIPNLAGVKQKTYKRPEIMYENGVPDDQFLTETAFSRLILEAGQTKKTFALKEIVRGAPRTVPISPVQDAFINFSNVDKARNTNYAKRAQEAIDEIESKKLGKAVSEVKKMKVGERKADVQKANRSGEIYEAQELMLTAVPSGLVDIKEQARGGNRPIHFKRKGIETFGLSGSKSFQESSSKRMAQAFEGIIQDTGLRTLMPSIPVSSAEDAMSSPGLRQSLGNIFDAFVKRTLPASIAEKQSDTQRFDLPIEIFRNPTTSQLLNKMFGLSSGSVGGVGAELKYDATNTTIGSMRDKIRANHYQEFASGGYIPNLSPAYLRLGSTPEESSYSEKGMAKLKSSKTRASTARSIAAIHGVDESQLSNPTPQFIRYLVKNKPEVFRDLVKKGVLKYNSFGHIPNLARESQMGLYDIIYSKKGAERSHLEIAEYGGLYSPRTGKVAMSDRENQFPGTFAHEEFGHGMFEKLAKTKWFATRLEMTKKKLLESPEIYQNAMANISGSYAKRYSGQMDEGVQHRFLSEAFAQNIGNRIHSEFNPKYDPKEDSYKRDGVNTLSGLTDNLLTPSILRRTRKYVGKNKDRLLNSLRPNKKTYPQILDWIEASGKSGGFIPNLAPKKGQIWNLLSEGKQVRIEDIIGRNKYQVRHHEAFSKIVSEKDLEQASMAQVMSYMRWRNAQGQYMSNGFLPNLAGDNYKGPIQNLSEDEYGQYVNKDEYSPKIFLPYYTKLASKSGVDIRGLNKKYGLKYLSGGAESAAFVTKGGKNVVKVPLGDANYGYTDKVERANQSNAVFENLGLPLQSPRARQITINGRKGLIQKRALGKTLGGVVSEAGLSKDAFKILNSLESSAQQSGDIYGEARKLKMKRAPILDFGSDANFIIPSQHEASLVDILKNSSGNYSGLMAAMKNAGIKMSAIDLFNGFIPNLAGQKLPENLGLSDGGKKRGVRILRLPNTIEQYREEASSVTSQLFKNPKSANRILGKINKGLQNNSTIQKILTSLEKGDRGNVEKELVGLLGEKHAYDLISKTGGVSINPERSRFDFNTEFGAAEVRTRGRINNMNVVLSKFAKNAKGIAKNLIVASNTQLWSGGKIPDVSASALNDAFKREKDAGYTPALGFDSRIGPLVYGSKEQGSAKRAVDQHLAMGESLSQIRNAGKAKGHVPNLAMDSGGAGMDILSGIGIFASQMMFARKGDQEGAKIQLKLEAQNKILEKQNAEKRDTSRTENAIRELNKRRLSHVTELEKREKLQSKLFKTSIIASGAGGMAQAALGGQSRAGRTAGALGESIGAGANIAFALPGPIGLAAGALVALTSATSKVYKIFNDQAPKIEKALDEERAFLQKSSDSVNNFAQIFDKLSTAYKNPASSADTLVKLNTEYLRALADIPETYRSLVASASDAAGAQRVFSEAIQERTNKFLQAESAKGFASKLDESRGAFVDSNIFEKGDVGKRQIEDFASNVISKSLKPDKFIKRVSSTNINSADDLRKLAEAAKEAGEIGNETADQLIRFAKEANGLQGVFDNSAKEAEAFSNSLSNQAKELNNITEKEKVLKPIREQQNKVIEALKTKAKAASESIAALNQRLVILSSRGLSIFQTQNELRNTAKDNLGNNQVSVIETMASAFGETISNRAKTSLDATLGLFKVQAEGASKFREADAEAVGKMFENVKNILNSSIELDEQGLPKNPGKKDRIDQALLSLSELRGSVSNPDQAGGALVNFINKYRELIGEQTNKLETANMEVRNELVAVRAKLDQGFREQVRVQLINNQIAATAQRANENANVLGGAKGFLNPQAFTDSLKQLVKGANLLSNNKGNSLFGGKGALDLFEGLSGMGFSINNRGGSALKSLATEGRAREIKSNAVDISDFLGMRGVMAKGERERSALFAASASVREFAGSRGDEAAKEQIDRIIKLDELPDNVAKQVKILEDIYKLLSSDISAAFNKGGAASGEIMGFSAQGMTGQIKAIIDARKNTEANLKNIDKTIINTQKANEQYNNDILKGVNSTAADTAKFTAAATTNSTIYVHDTHLEKKFDEVKGSSGKGSFGGSKAGGIALQALGIGGGALAAAVAAKPLMNVAGAGYQYLKQPFQAGMARMSGNKGGLLKTAASYGKDAFKYASGKIPDLSGFGGKGPGSVTYQSIAGKTPHDDLFFRLGADKGLIDDVAERNKNITRTTSLGTRNQTVYTAQRNRSAVNQFGRIRSDLKGGAVQATARKIINEATGGNIIFPTNKTTEYAKRAVARLQQNISKRNAPINQRIINRSLNRDAIQQVTKDLDTFKPVSKAGRKTGGLSGGSFSRGGIGTQINTARRASGVAASSGLRTATSAATKGVSLPLLSTLIDYGSTSLGGMSAGASSSDALSDRLLQDFGAENQEKSFFQKMMLVGPHAALFEKLTGSSALSNASANKIGTIDSLSRKGARGLGLNVDKGALDYSRENYSAEQRIVDMSGALKTQKNNRAISGLESKMSGSVKYSKGGDVANITREINLRKAINSADSKEGVDFAEKAGVKNLSNLDVASRKTILERRLAKQQEKNKNITLTKDKDIEVPNAVAGKYGYTGEKQNDNAAFLALGKNSNAFIEGSEENKTFRLMGQRLGIFSGGEATMSRPNALMPGQGPEVGPDKNSLAEKFKNFKNTLPQEVANTPAGKAKAASKGRSFAGQVGTPEYYSKNQSIMDEANRTIGMANGQPVYARQDLAWARNMTGGARDTFLGKQKTAKEIYMDSLPPEQRVRKQYEERMRGAANQPAKPVTQEKPVDENKQLADAIGASIKESMSGVQGQVAVTWPTLNINVSGGVSSSGGGAAPNQDVLINIIKNQIFDALGRADLKVPVQTSAGQQAPSSTMPSRPTNRF